MPRSHCRTLATFAALLAVSSVSPAAEPSPQFRAELQRTIEKRKERRRTRTAQPVGAVVPYPFPPALIIRHTPEVHDEIQALLRALR